MPLSSWLILTEIYSNVEDDLRFICSVAELTRRHWLLPDTFLRHHSWIIPMSAAMTPRWLLHACCWLWTWTVTASG